MFSDRPVIEVRGLTKRFRLQGHRRARFFDLLLRRKSADRQFTALKDIHFSCVEGETIGVIGKNGSGKSTLLQLICGTLTPTEGSVKTVGKVAALLELGAGFNAEFSGRENVYIYGALYGLSQAEVRRRFSQIEAFAELGEHIDQPVKTYSSGMYVRLAFAVIAHVDANVLIIDEALSVGDAFFNQKCMRFLKDFMSRGTVFFVSHDLAAVSSLCRRVLWLEKGILKADSDPKSVTEMYLASWHRDHDGSAEGPVTSDSFGRQGALVESATLFGADGQSLEYVRGGERVRLEITCRLQQNLSPLLVGFLINDKMGRTVFGDNSSVSHPELTADAGQSVTAHFDFTMPILAAGEYVVAAAVAEGTQAHHVQHHWVHNALLFYAQPRRPCYGVVGTPIESVEIKIHAAAESVGPE